ncbi:MAG TPA: DUF4309 domain-containing protein [Bacillota bacterium]|nr:DUF4309 domain-containing protein [Bacillota bacterium]
MKKKFIYAMLVIGLLLLSSCSLIDKNFRNEQPSPTPKTDESSKASEEYPEQEQTQEPERTLDEEPSTEAAADETAPADEHDSHLELVRQGRVDGISFGLGDSTEFIIDGWGEPDESEYYMGGLYLLYDDEGVVFFTSADGEYGQISSHGEIVFIGITKENKEVYGVRIGMTFDEIIEVLGEPEEKRTAEQNESSELLFGWTIDYIVGEYTVSFQADTGDGQVDVVYLWASEKKQ